MQCTRCYSGGSTTRRIGRIHVTTKHRHQMQQHVISSVETPWEGGRVDRSSMEDAELTFSSFFKYYRGALAICGVSGLFCAASLVLLGESVLHLGVPAIPLLLFFITGLTLSLALPLKLHREYAAIHGVA